jgi:hypothetical protein
MVGVPLEGDRQRHGDRQRVVVVMVTHRATVTVNRTSDRVSAFQQ